MLKQVIKHKKEGQYIVLFYRNNMQAIKMRIKILFIDWYANFQCVGGICPLTCCSTKWNIGLSDEEIENYYAMEHPFAEKIIYQIDEEKKCMKSKGEVCALLTEDGFCQIVLECGEQYLSKTCKVFPRRIKQFGDVFELYVELVCPVVSEKMLDEKQIQFGLEEEECDGEIEPIDYRIYDCLSLARSFIIDIFQEFPGKYISGKVYIFYNIMIKIKSTLSISDSIQEDVNHILEKYSDLQSRVAIYSSCEQVYERYSQKAIFIRKLLIKLWNVIIYVCKDNFSEDNCTMELFQTWRSNSEILEECLKGFSDYLKKEYPLMSENYFVYSIFGDWVEMDKEMFGKKLTARCVEFLIIQLLAMAFWKQEGCVAKEKYQIMISQIDRIFSHKKDFLEDVAEIMQELEEDNVANVIMILV